MNYSGLFLGIMKNKVVFSKDRKHRFYLEVGLPNNGKENSVVFIMLNPSTSDETSVDPTVKRCMNIATNCGFTKLIVINLFSLISLYPKDLKVYGNRPNTKNEVRNVLTLMRVMKKNSSIVVAREAN